MAETKIILLALIFLVTALASLMLGTARTSLNEIIRALSESADNLSASGRIIRFVRLPRVCGCILAGTALAVSGVVIQSVLSNPLAAPNIIGVNAGAGAGTVLCCALFPSYISFAPAAAFFGALVSVFVVLFISEKTGASRITLVLAGVAISGIFNALIDATITFVPDVLSSYTDFRIGSLANLTMARITPAFFVIAAALTTVLLLAPELDVLMLGSETAHSLGLPVKKMRVVFLGLAAALAGAAVSFSGLLGFIGLIVPHIMRKLIGEESRVLLPACSLGGAAMLLLCDLISRVMFIPYELPVGIILSLGGGPFFIWLLLRQRRSRI